MLLNFIVGRSQQTEGDTEIKRTGRARPLYEIPYMFEAREFLRKKLIGKKVGVLFLQSFSLFDY